MATASGVNVMLMPALASVAVTQARPTHSFSTRECDTGRLCCGCCSRHWHHKPTVYCCVDGAAQASFDQGNRYSGAHVAQVSALSPDGRCKAFGADADGYGRGEGIASIVMRPLEDAEPGVDDRPLALLTGSAVNQDGRSSSLTVSSVQLARRYRTSRANSSQDAVQ